MEHDSFRRDSSTMTTQPFRMDGPHDCADGFLGPYWRRPWAYLDPDVRKGISSFASCRDLSPLQRLADDLDTGEWQRRNSELLEADELDIGYQLVVGCPA